MRVGKIVAAVLVIVSISYGSISIDLAGIVYGKWILGSTPPTIRKPIAVAHGAPDEKYLELGFADPFYWETKDGFDDEGSVTMWIYDSANRLDATQTSGNGPHWGLRSTDLGQVMVVGVFRRSYNSGDLGYHPWSSVNPLSVFSFRDGVRGSHGTTFNAGWYKWTVKGTFDDITFTLHDVLLWGCQDSACEPRNPEIMDAVKVIDATFAGGSMAGVFGFGWSGIAFKGEELGHPENFYVQIVSGTGVFKDVGGDATSIKPTETSSWGNIKGLY